MFVDDCVCLFLSVSVANCFVTRHLWLPCGCRCAHNTDSSRSSSCSAVCRRSQHLLLPRRLQSVIFPHQLTQADTQADHWWYEAAGWTVLTHRLAHTGLLGQRRRWSRTNDDAPTDDDAPTARKGLIPIRLIANLIAHYAFFNCTCYTGTIGYDVNKVTQSISVLCE